MSDGKQNLPPELINFMGQMYADTKKLDSSVIGHSDKRISENIKKELTNLVNTQHKPSSSVNIPPPQPTIPVPNANTASLEQVNMVPQQPDQTQLELNFDVNDKEKIFNILHDIMSSLKTIKKDIKLLNETKDTKQKKIC